MHFSRPVTAYMTTDLVVVTPDMLLSRVGVMLEERNISTVPVIVDDGGAQRIITHTDLLHAGRVERDPHTGIRTLLLPDLRVETVAAHEPVVCDTSTSLRDAARRMVEARVHRVFVLEGSRMVGVISTHDLAAAVRDARVAIPLLEVANAAAVSVPADTTVRRARVALERSLAGVIVELDGWPIGVFTPSDALASRDLSPDLAVEAICDRAVLALPATLPLFHAAAQAAALDPCRVIAMRGRELAGVADGLDLARVVAS